MKDSFNHIFKNIVFAIIPLLLIVIFVELAGRIYYFNYMADETFAVQPIYKKLKRTFILYKSQSVVSELEDIKIPQELLFTKQGDRLLKDLKDKYEKYFRELKEQVDNIDAKFVVLYIQSDDYSGEHKKRGTVCRNFYQKLAEKYHVDFIDLTSKFSKYDIKTVTLLPENGHLSRFGNILVADKLQEYLDSHRSYHSDHTYKNPPKLLGDLKPNQNRAWTIVDIMPYNVITNSQGLRMSHDLTFPKQKRRVLILGDSYTFGPYLGNHNTFPGLLAKKINDMEIINAGVAGYTIPMELDLFKKRAKYVNPDFVILQVLDNDIYGLTTYKMNQYDRAGKVYNLSEVEIELLEAISKEDKSNE